MCLPGGLRSWHGKGHSGVVVTNNDPADFSSLTDFFDVILTDVPCSGEGLNGSEENIRKLLLQLLMEYEKLPETQ